MALTGYHFLASGVGVPAFLGGGTLQIFDGFKLERDAYLVAICDRLGQVQRHT
jgi:hypothetical protein